MPCSREVDRFRRMNRLRCAALRTGDRRKAKRARRLARQLAAVQREQIRASFESVGRALHKWLESVRHAYEAVARQIAMTKRFENVTQRVRLDQSVLDAQLAALVAPSRNAR